MHTAPCAHLILVSPMEGKMMSLPMSRENAIGIWQWQLLFPKVLGLFSVHKF